MARKPAAIEEEQAFAPPYRVMVVDDHTVVRLGLRALVQSQPGVELCCEAVTGEEAIELAKQCKPDLVILDLTLAEKNGLEVLEAIRAEMPETEVLVLTMHFSEEIAREALRLGAIGYVLKSDADTDLLAAVDNARHHQPFFTSRLAATMAQNFVSPQAGGDGGNTLTPRETEVVRLLASGRSNKEVAGDLKVSTRTVESHRHHIMKKMGFGNFSELVKFAVRNDLVEL
ncbi:MAG TPA: response regulator transcription factor [Candidatus Acidoferrales bacterium]|nr:response regulator transcription factor [Candidatus Acidoferrales bacterium]